MPKFLIALAFAVLPWLGTAHARESSLDHGCARHRNGTDVHAPGDRKCASMFASSPINAQYEARKCERGGRKMRTAIRTESL